MMLRTTLVLAAMVLAGCAPSLLARESDAVEPGARVRVETLVATRLVTGRVMSLDGTTLTLAVGHPASYHTQLARIPVSDIHRIEVWRGTRPTGRLGRAFGIGAGVGAGVGLLVGGFLHGMANLDNQSGRTISPELPWVGALGGAAGGGLIGLALGAASVEDVWGPVSLPDRRVQIGLAPAPGGGWHAGLAVRF
jgi:hypothetical protein